MCTINPFVDLTFLAFWICVFSFNQLKNDSMGCLTVDTSVTTFAFLFLPLQGMIGKESGMKQVNSTAVCALKVSDNRFIRLTNSLYEGNIENYEDKYSYPLQSSSNDQLYEDCLFWWFCLRPYQAPCFFSDFRSRV